jgi:hypothetical protein
MDHRRGQNIIMMTADRIPIGERRYNFEEFVELRRKALRDARSFPPGSARNQRRQVALSLRALCRNRSWPRADVWDADTS